MVRAVIFDFDGVIVNSDAFNIRVLREIFQKHHIPLTEGDFFTYFAGKKLHDALTTLLGKYNRAKEVEAFISEKRTYDAQFPSSVEVYPQALETIKELAKNYRLALATGSRRAVIELFFEKYALYPFFQSIITAEDCTQGKPHPEPYLRSLERVKVSSPEAVVIEDAPAGIISARDAGIKCVAIESTHSSEQLKDANSIVKNIGEIIGAIETIESLETP